ncbi:hypothetical protein M9H77_06207 [Catharanthus roseus]|uniref:Uncharacterized protein n=1 Tax=Catharanthus roseus TaxID=4058 RepID=A0ACC0BRN2_CATRO|nr:hypothetical protein M9H77_06207 [Catharanthus roseus]
MESLLGLKRVNINFYPKCPNPELTVGVGRHSDIGILTTLLQDGIGGLQVKVEEDDGIKEEWIEIKPVEGALVINVGDDALQKTYYKGNFTWSEDRALPLFNNSVQPLPRPQIQYPKAAQ